MAADRTWAWFERHDNWHLIVDEDIESLGGDRVAIVYISWCGHRFAEDVPRKPAGILSPWADALHDECLRRAEELDRG